MATTDGTIGKKGMFLEESKYLAFLKKMAILF